MSFQPIIVGTGLQAWQFLKSTQETQVANFNKSTVLARDVAYFKENIGNISSAKELVEDRQLLNVALSSVGLEDQIDSKSLIQKVLEEGTEDGSLANRLNDGRYVALAQAFNFDPIPASNISDEGFSDPILENYAANVLANMEASLAESGDTDTEYGESVRAQVLKTNESESAYFSETIGSISSAQELVDNPRLLPIVLLAFGLEEKINSKALITRVLEQGADDENDLANVLGDQRYVDLAKAFGFEKPATTALNAPDFAESIAADYRSQAFDVAIGEIDNDLRTALNFERAIPDLATNSSSESTRWFQVLGTTSLRNVFQSALGLPDGFSQIDLDKQVEVLQEKVEARFGVSTFAEIAQPEVRDRLIETYLLRQQAQAGLASGTGQVALTLLQSIPKSSLLG